MHCGEYWAIVNKHMAQLFTEFYNWEYCGQWTMAKSRVTVVVKQWSHRTYDLNASLYYTLTK